MNWIINKNIDEEKAKDIANALKIPQKIAEVFVNRGFDLDDVKKFLDFKEVNIPDIASLSDAMVAVNRIGEATNLGEHIVVYADYDADGTCACSVMVRALRHLGAKVDYYTNDRFKQGFGMKVDGVKELIKKYPNVSLIVTVDNGIVAFDAADYIKEQGIDLIITDHHEPSVDGLLPEALAVVDHKRFDDKYPFKELCGTGIAYRLMKKLYEEMGESLDYIYDLLPLVAVGTVADCVSMTEENRYYVKLGLSKMGNSIIPAFAILSELFKVKVYNEDTIGFYFGPMINSSSRLIGNAIKPIEFFTSDDIAVVQALGDELFTINEQRKSMTDEQMKKAEEIVENLGKANNEVIVVYEPTFAEGLVGIIAGRITEKYRKPSIVFTDNEEFIKGSARSVEGFNIKEAFDALAENIYNYGGHAMAAGITLEPNDLDMFEELLNNYANGKVPTQNTDIAIDISLDSPDEITLDLLNGYNEYLRPFGTDWAIAKVRVGGWDLSNPDVAPNIPTIRALKDVHLKVTNRFNNADFGLLNFNTGITELKELLKLPEDYDLTGAFFSEKLEAIGEMDINVFKGNISFQFIVKDGMRIQE